MINYTENTLIEKPAIDLFESLGWKHANGYYETFGQHGTFGRESAAEVVLIKYLRASLIRLNPKASESAIDTAIEEIIKERRAMSLVQANKEVYKLLKDGVKVDTKDNPDQEGPETIRIIDWENPKNNDFLLISQFWIAGDMYKRRADLVGFVNGLPIVFIELKTSHRKLELAFRDNLRDYKNTITDLFNYNAFVILSNGSYSRIGSMTSDWETFAEWKKINREGEEGIISLETMIRGTCEPSRLMDLIENFILFKDGNKGTDKLVGKNHQFLGVNNAIEAVRDLRGNQGRLGVFWHTQGSGKSYSMVLFAQKILRKIPGNWTFVIVTDRIDLDRQIYTNFVNVGALTEPEERIHAGSAAHLKQLLQEDHRYVFTLIQKFQTEKGEKYPMLSGRSDIIVITDEAHRSQYDIMAMNMRLALPNAAFIGFTGTPLMAGEEKTREVFGEYVSIYNFKQSIDDRATVPLYYENRIPELQLTNENLNEDIQRIVDEADLNEDEMSKLEREFSHEYYLITREDRLETIAEDMVSHFIGRGHWGKAMFIAIDKMTAVRMYNKVQKYWKIQLDKLKAQAKTARIQEKEALKVKIDFMESTDMAVVLSSSQNEQEDFAKKGLDIVPHRKRMNKEDLDVKFKDPDDPFRIVFVCAMWITGFDVPSCSTIYLDKPMRNHTLMQTIARANRVFRDKNNGLIVDYIGVFRSLQKALSIYGTGPGGSWNEGDSPVKPKAALIEALRKAVEEVQKICTELGVDLAAFETAKEFELVKLLDDAADAILQTDETKKRYLLASGQVIRLYKAILPDPDAHEFYPIKCHLTAIAKKIKSELPEVDISMVLDEIDALLDRSIAAESYVIDQRRDQSKYLDLSKIDFEGLKKHFAKVNKHTEVQKLKSLLQTRVLAMVRMNPTRIDYLEKLQTLIDEYNEGSLNTDQMYKELLEFTKSLNIEEHRAIAESLSEEELAIFDLLTKPELEMTEKDRKAVRKVAKDLLNTLKTEKLVLDWRKKLQSRASVRLSIEEMLDHLPKVYTPQLFEQKCDVVYQYVYEYGG